MPPLSDSMLCDEDRRALLARARQAVFEAVRLCLADLPPAAGRLAEPGGAFVTLLCDGKLRGCIGHTDCETALAETVVQCAITAAMRDPRFKPLRVEELAGLEIEISVVSELRPIRPEELELGVHGIVVIRGGSRGLLLPQVAVERHCAATQSLEATCPEARLAPYVS